MPRKVPPFPVLVEPGEWDALTLLVATTFLEGEGEPLDGQLGIAWVPITRVQRGWAADLHAAILGPDRRAYDDGRDYEPFSCWNTDYRTRAAGRLASAGDRAAQCWYVAGAVLGGLRPDPTGGAVYYLNVALTLIVRGGTLPRWAAHPGNPREVDPHKVLAVLGQHHFLAG